MQFVSHLVSLCVIFACSYFPLYHREIKGQTRLKRAASSFLLCGDEAKFNSQKENLIKASHLFLNADCTSKIIHTFTRIVFLRRCMSDLTSSLWSSSQCSGLGLVMVGEPYIRPVKCRLWESCSQHRLWLFFWLLFDFLPSLISLEVFAFFICYVDFQLIKPLRPSPEPPSHALASNSRQLQLYCMKPVTVPATTDHI